MVRRTYTIHPILPDSKEQAVSHYVTELHIRKLGNLFLKLGRPLFTVQLFKSFYIWYSLNKLWCWLILLLKYVFVLIVHEGRNLKHYQLYNFLLHLKTGVKTNNYKAIPIFRAFTIAIEWLVIKRKLINIELQLANKKITRASDSWPYMKTKHHCHNLKRKK